MLHDLISFARDFARFAGARGLIAVAMALAAAAVEAVTLVLLAPLLALLAGAVPPTHIAARALAAANVGGPSMQLAVLLAAMATLWIARGLLSWARDQQLTMVAVDFAEAQRRTLVTRLAQADWIDIAPLDQARVTQALGTDIIRIAQASQMLVHMLVAGIMIVAFAAAALAIAPVLAAIALTVTAGVGALLAQRVRRTHDVGGLAVRANLDLGAAAARFMGGLKLALVHHQQPEFVAQVNFALAAVRAQQNAAMHHQNAARFGLSVAALGVAALVMVIGQGWFNVPLPILGALIVVLARLGGPMAQLQHALHQLAFVLPGYAALHTLAATIGPPPPAPQATRDPVVPALADEPAALIVAAVRFAYPRTASAGARAVLDDVSFTLSPGEIIGLGGASGAGKSTLADLLVGLLPPQSGAIWRGDTPLIGGALEVWRARVAYAGQDAYLFHGTVRDNLAWGNPPGDDAAIWHALDTVQAADLVRALPLGLETLVGDRGALLSGGERQRLALARAILRGGELLVLDEATSAVDLATESRIFAALRAGLGRGMMLVIAHRAETLALCTRQLWLENGRIVPVHPGEVR